MCVNIRACCVPEEENKGNQNEAANLIGYSPHGPSERRVSHRTHSPLSSTLVRKRVLRGKETTSFLTRITVRAPHTSNRVITISYAYLGRCIEVVYPSLEVLCPTIYVRRHPQGIRRLAAGLFFPPTSLEKFRPHHLHDRAAPAIKR